MSNKKVKTDAERNEEMPPFTFRFASKKLKKDIERSANRTHRTIAGVINRACEVYLMTSRGVMV